MAELYNRQISVIVSTKDGDGLELSAFRVVFEVRQFEGATPNTLDLRINNLSRATFEKIKKEFTHVVVKVGYAGRYGKLFEGNIVQARYGRESSVDTYVAITAADGDRAHNYAIVAQTLASGSTPADVHAAACTAMNPHGVTQGYTAPMDGPALPRGRVLYGMARNVLTRNAQTVGHNWTILDGQVQTVPEGGYLPSTAVVLTAKTGMIGLPQITMDGIMVRCLLDPSLRCMTRVKLDNASIQEARIGTDPAAQANAARIPGKDADGIYKILAVDHTGDTRGTPWYSDIVCVSADPNAVLPISQIQRLRGGDGSPAPLGIPQTATSTTTAATSPAALDPAPSVPPTPTIAPLSATASGAEGVA